MFSLVPTRTPISFSAELFLAGCHHHVPGGAVPPQVQDSVLVLIELHEVPILQSVKVSLDQFRVIYEFTEVVSKSFSVCKGKHSCVPFMLPAT